MTDAADPVVVVGAGPTGLTAALLLARRGVATVVLDRHTVPDPAGDVVLLDDECVRILQQVGLDDGFLAISRPVPGMRLLDPGLRPFATFRRDRSPARHGYPGVNLARRAGLEHLLRGAADRDPLVDLRGGVEATGVLAEPAGALAVEIRDGSAEGLGRVPAAAVLGCDGPDGVVREALHTREHDLRFSQTWLVVEIECTEPLWLWDGVDQVCDPLRAATFLHVDGDTYRWAFRMYPGETAEDLSRPENLELLLAPWVGHLRAEREGTTTPESGIRLVRAGARPVRATVVDRWDRGRVFVLGSAAHRMPPFAGAALGTGLRDAFNLSWKLAAVLAQDADETLLAGYTAERAPHALAAIRAGVRLGHAMTGGNGRLAGVRQPLAVASLRVPGARHRLVRSLATRYPASASVDERAGRRDLPGTVCPQPRVRVGGVPARLDDVLGTGWALLCAGPVDAALAARAELLGARTVRLAGRGTGGHPADHTVHDPDGVLAAWLRRGRTTAVLLRPDRVVASVGATDGRRPRLPRVSRVKALVRVVRPRPLRWLRTASGAVRRRRR